MLNTGADRELNVDCATNEQSTHFNCFATKDIQQGQQLLGPYSKQAGNTRLLAGYGFVLQNNPHSTVQVEISVAAAAAARRAAGDGGSSGTGKGKGKGKGGQGKGEAAAAAAASVLKKREEVTKLLKLPLADGRLSLSFSAGHNLPNQLLSFCRVQSLPQQALLATTATLSELAQTAFSVMGFGARVEEAAVAAAAAAVEHTIAAYGSSLKEDLALLFSLQAEIQPGVGSQQEEQERCQRGIVHLFLPSFGKDEKRQQYTEVMCRRGGAAVWELVLAVRIEEKQILQRAQTVLREHAKYVENVLAELEATAVEDKKIRIEL